MADDRLIAALDIGTTIVSAAIAEYNDDGELEIIGLGTAPSHGLRRGVVINIEATLRSVALAVEAAEQMAGREIAEVVTGIAGGHIEGLNSRGVVAVTGKGREITPEDVDRVIDAAKAVVIPMDREVIHVIPQEFIVDEQGGIRNPLDMIGVRLEAEVHIITGSVTSAQNLVKCVNRAGFKVSDIVLESLASARSVLTEDERELGAMLIDLGGGTTDILIYREGAPYYTSVLPVGGAQVTGDLSIMLKTPTESAEQIKHEAGCCYMPLVEVGEPVIIPGVGGRPPASSRATRSAGSSSRAWERSFRWSARRSNRRVTCAIWVRESCSPAAGRCCPARSSSRRRSLARRYGSGSRAIWGGSDRSIRRRSTRPWWVWFCTRRPRGNPRRSRLR